MSINHDFWREEKGESKWIEPRSLCLPAKRLTARPHRLTVSQLDVTCYICARECYFIVSVWTKWRPWFMSCLMNVRVVESEVSSSKMFLVSGISAALMISSSSGSMVRNSRSVLAHCWCQLLRRVGEIGSVHFSPLTDPVVGGTWRTIQQRPSSSLFCRRPLWAVLTLGMDIFDFVNPAFPTMQRATPLLFRNSWTDINCAYLVFHIMYLQMSQLT